MFNWYITTFQTDNIIILFTMITFNVFLCLHVNFWSRAHDKFCRTSTVTALLYIYVCTRMCVYVSHQYYINAWVCALFYYLDHPLKICIEQNHQTVIGNSSLCIFFATHTFTQDKCVSDVILKLLRKHNALATLVRHDYLSEVLGEFFQLFSTVWYLKFIFVMV